MSITCHLRLYAPSFKYQAKRGLTLRFYLEEFVWMDRGSIETRLLGGCKPLATALGLPLDTSQPSATFELDTWPPWSTRCTLWKSKL